MRRLIQAIPQTLLGVGALIWASGCALTPEPRALERKYYGAWEQDTGYAQVVRVGSTLYLSGITSGKPTLAEQVDDIYHRIQSILADYGVTTDQIVKEVVYTLNMEELKQAGEIRKKYYPAGDFPAATWVQIDRLYSEGRFVEIEVIAEIPTVR